MNLLQAVNTVVAGILHDVIDDTLENLRTIEEEFGDDVAHLVAGVSKLSYINQACHYIIDFFFFEESVNICQVLHYIFDIPLGH